MDQETQQQIQELLAQLKDVHTLPSSWWPPAPGWWIVALVILSVLGFFALRFYRGNRQFRWIAVAETELTALESAFELGELDEQTTVKRLSVLMRRSAIAALGRERVARATDEQWIQVISEVGNGCFSRSDAELLQSAPYKAQSLSGEQVQGLLKSCSGWLAGARARKQGSHV